jgi:hypothetical protein
MKMNMSLVLRVAFSACLASLAAAGWSPGTATFYGGADGSGTMGKLASSGYTCTTHAQALYMHTPLLTTSAHTTVGMQAARAGTTTCTTPGTA